MQNYQFTIAWITDTQYYSMSHPEILKQVIDWLNSEGQSGRINYVVHTGDLVQIYNNLTQWTTFASYWRNLTIDSDLLAGNHDNAGGKVWTYYDSYFPNNRYHCELRGEWLFIFLSFSLGSDINIQTWLRNVTIQNSDKKIVVLTHAYIDYDMSLTVDGNAIENVLSEFSSKDYVVWCGHSHINRIVYRTGSNTVAIVHDFQEYANGGNGYLVLVDMYENGFYMHLYSVIEDFDGKGKGEGYEVSVILSDMTPPRTMHDYDGLWHTEDTVINLAAKDAVSGVAETYYRINDGSTRTVSTDGQPTVNTEGSNNTLEYWSIDNAGIEESPHKILTGIKIDKTPPKAYAGQNRTISINENITLDASDSTDNIAILRYEWDFGDGTAGEGEKATHFYTSPGTYNLTLTVRDMAGNTSSHTITVTVIGAESYASEIAGVVIASAGIVIAVTLFLLRRREGSIF